MVDVLLEKKEMAGIHPQERRPGYPSLCPSLHEPPRGTVSWCRLYVGQTSQRGERVTPAPWWLLILR